MSKMSLPKQTETIAGMRKAVEYVRASLKSKRNKESLCRLLDSAEAMVNSLGIEIIQMPHQRKPLKRFCGGAEYYRPDFYQVIAV